ncbi:MAG: hypothetical protein Q9216_001473 [Gyalolechia sp. 2 TL-2023]
MEEKKLETTEPDPSSTAISNDMPVNTDTVMQNSNPTAEANSKVGDDLPVINDVDKAIAEVEARREEKEDPSSKETTNAVAVETNGHETAKEKDENVDAEKKEPSERVKEGQKWNNRDRNARPRKDFKDYKKNYISDLTSQKESSDPVAIRKQVEFYFSDSNLLQDKFLFEKVQGHDNLPIPISIIHSFKRMRHFQPFSAIVDALRESTTLDVVGNDNDHIQRKTPLPEGLKDKSMGEIKQVLEGDAMKRSVYVKGFGKEEPSTQFDIEAFFAEYGPTNSVRLRRAADKVFKSSVFVEFDSEETQKKFLEFDPKPKWRGQDLIIKSKKQYCDDKVEDIKAGRIKPRFSEERRSQAGDDRDWKTRRAEDQRNGHRGRGGGGGGGRGFGSKGGRARGGGGNAGRGRHGGRRDRDDRNVPKVATTTDSGDEASKAETKTETAPTVKQDPQASAGETAQSAKDSVPKKRAREEDHDNDEAEPSKKVATEVAAS